MRFHAAIYIFFMLCACTTITEKKPVANDKKPRANQVAPPAITHRFYTRTLYLGVELGFRRPYNKAYLFAKTKWANGNYFCKSCVKKVDAMVGQKCVKNKWTNEDMEDLDILTEQEMSSLNCAQLMYYCLAYPTAYEQNCSGPNHFEPNENILYHNFIGFETGRTFTATQKQRLLAKRDSVYILLKKILPLQRTIGTEYLQLIKELQLTELMPLLCSKADFVTNTFCFTVITAFMHDNEYQPYETFYRDSLFEQRKLDGSMDMKINARDIQRIKQFGMDYYHTMH